MVGFVKSEVISNNVSSSLLVSIVVAWWLEELEDEFNLFQRNTPRKSSNYEKLMTLLLEKFEDVITGNIAEVVVAQNNKMVSLLNEFKQLKNEKTKIKI